MVTCTSLVTILPFAGGSPAAAARPAIALALQHQKLPSQVAVFVGRDTDATDGPRSYFLGYLPSSSSIGLLKEGKLVHMIEHSDIEGRSPEAIAHNFVSAFDDFC